MLIGIEGRRSNLRVMYGILATSALARFDAARVHSGQQDMREVYFVNLIRLLEMYRYGTFYSPPPNGVLERKSLASNPLSHPDTGNESKFVLGAIERAHASVSNLPREQFVESMEAVFDALHRRAVDSLDAASITEARNFLTAFIAELRNGIDNA